MPADEPKILPSSRKAATFAPSVDKEQTQTEGRLPLSTPGLNPAAVPRLAHHEGLNDLDSDPTQRFTPNELPTLTQALAHSGDCGSDESPRLMFTPAGGENLADLNPMQGPRAVVRSSQVRRNLLSWRRSRVMSQRTSHCSAPPGDLDVTISDSAPRRHLRAAADARGTVMRRSECQVPDFSKAARRVEDAKLKTGTVCAILTQHLDEEAMMYGLFSFVEPFSWHLLQQMYAHYACVRGYLGMLSERIEELHPGACVEETCMQTCVPPPIPTALQPVLSVILQLCSFFITFRENTDRSYEDFTRAFCQGGFIAFGPAILAAVCISAAETVEELFERSQEAVHMAYCLGKLQQEQSESLAKPDPGQSYVLHVHNISLPCLERVLQQCNTRDRAESAVVVCCVVSSRSFFLCGHPSDLDYIRGVLRGLAEQGFKFGTRFLDFGAPMGSPFYNTELAEDVLSLWQEERISISGDDLKFEVFSPVNGKGLQSTGDDLLFELSTVLTTQPGSSTAQHAHMPFRAAIISFEVLNNPAQLGGHNLICSQLMLQTPYISCVSQPYSFKHQKPSLAELHPRNTTRSSRANVLLKLAVMQEQLRPMGYTGDDLQLVESWLEHGIMERRHREDKESTKHSQSPGDRKARLSQLFTQFSPAPAAQRMSVSGPDIGTPRVLASGHSTQKSSPIYKGASGPNSPAEPSLSSVLLNEDEDLEEELLRDAADIARSSNLYNLERLESMGTLLVEMTDMARRFLQRLSEVARHFFPRSTLHKCPSVIYLIEYWDVLDFVAQSKMLPSPREARIVPAPKATLRRLSHGHKAAVAKGGNRRTSHPPAAAPAAAPAPAPARALPPAAAAPAPTAIAPRPPAPPESSNLPPALAAQQARAARGSAAGSSWAARGGPTVAPEEPGFALLCKRKEEIRRFMMHIYTAVRQQ